MFLVLCVGQPDQQGALWGWLVYATQLYRSYPRTRHPATGRVLFDKVKAPFRFWWSHFVYAKPRSHISVCETVAQVDLPKTSGRELIKNLVAFSQEVLSFKLQHFHFVDKATGHDLMSKYWHTFAALSNECRFDELNTTLNPMTAWSTVKIFKFLFLSKGSACLQGWSSGEFLGVHCVHDHIQHPFSRISNTPTSHLGVMADDRNSSSCDGATGNRWWRLLYPLVCTLTLTCTMHMHNFQLLEGSGQPNAH